MKKNRGLLTTLLLLLFHIVAWAQNATIKGRITSADGQPAAYVSVGLKNKPQNTSTLDDGTYALHKIKAGSYVLRVSAIGIVTQEKNISISDGQTLELNFVLSENSQILKEVSVQAKKNAYKISTPDNSLRLNQPLLEAAQNIQSVSGQAIKDQQIISMSDGVLRNVSGAIRTSHWGDLYANVRMRGSQIQAMRNGFNFVNSFWGPLTEDMSIVDHIEFVKGPAGFMLSNGDPSGMYNVVTKKPTGLNKGEVSFTLGSFDLYRTTIDLDRKLTEDGKLLFRLNAAAQQKGSFRPNESNDRYSIAPVISYQLTKSTKITAEYNLQRAQMTDVGSYYVFSTEGYISLPREFTYAPKNLPKTSINDHSVFLNLTQNIGEKWKITAQTAYSKYLQTGSSLWPADVLTNGDVIRSVGIWDAESTMKLGQVFINGEVKTGGIKHRILAGFDIGKKDYMADWGQSHPLDLPSGPFNMYHPNLGYPPNGFPNFDRTTSLKARAIAAGGTMGQKYTGGYLQDELGFFDNRARLTLAARYTKASQYQWGGTSYSANKLTPRIGLSVSLDRNTSVYGVYDQAFLPQSGKLKSGGEIKPITGSNMEVGFKRDWADGKWNTTLSLYRILKENELTADIEDKTFTYSVILGKKVAKGIELDIKGELTKGLSLIANYAYTDAKITSAFPNSGFANGDLVPGYAKHTTNAWLSYTIQTGFLKDFGLNAGITYLKDRTSFSHSATNPAQNMSDYTKVDAGLFWSKGPVKVTANVFNLLNEYLYIGDYYTNYFSNSVYSWQAEAPRNYRFGIAYKF